MRNMLGHATPRRLGQIVKQSVADLFIDSGPQWAAAVAYYSLLSIFPLLLAGAAIAAYFVDPEWAVVATSVIRRRISLDRIDINRCSLLG